MNAYSSADLIRYRPSHSSKKQDDPLLCFVEELDGHLDFLGWAINSETTAKTQPLAHFSTYTCFHTAAATNRVSDRAHAFRFMLLKVELARKDDDDIDNHVRSKSVSKFGPQGRSPNNALLLSGIEDHVLMWRWLSARIQMSNEQQSCHLRRVSA